MANQPSDWPILVLDQVKEQNHSDSTTQDATARRARRKKAHGSAFRHIASTAELWFMRPRNSGYRPP
jgi:hypothetical protein